MLHPKPKLIIIGGPTAIGKTRAAIQLAQRLGTEIISADSRQIYRQLAIGVGRPTEEELKTAKHHLIGKIDIHQHYHAADFEKDALTLLENIYTQHPYAIVCGGTGLYIQTLCDGIDEMPEVNTAIREQLNARFTQEGISFLQNYIYQHDPQLVASIDMHNHKRLIRAVEIMEQTQRPYSTFRKSIKKERFFEPIFFCLYDEREQIKKNITSRIELMLTQGWIEECQKLLPFKHLKALQTVGYKDIFEYLEGKITYPEMKQLILTHTNQYAKRQLTWFKRDARYHWVKNLDEIYKTLDLK